MSHPDTDHYCNEQRTTFYADFKGAKRAKFGREGGQVRKVAKHLDGSGFGSRRPRGPSRFEGPYGASIQELGGFCEFQLALETMKPSLSGDVETGIKSRLTTS